MIGVQRSVALCAGLLRTFADGVRGMATRALRVSRDARCRQHDDAGVAGATAFRCFLLELVWSMTTHALAVSAGEERACGDDRALRGVAALASRECLGRFCVLVLVAGRAHVLR